MIRSAFAVLSCVVLCGCPESLPSVQGIEVPLNSDNFKAEVLDSQTPVLVDFGATWCGPCRQMEPIIAQVSLDYQGRLKVGKVDIDNSPALASQYDVSGIPAMILFIDGQEVDRTIGGQPAEDLMAWVDSHLPQPSAAPADPAVTDPAESDSTTPAAEPTESTPVETAAPAGT